MQGSIAQTLSLVMTGNAWLQGHAVGRYWPEASVFQFCRTVEFVAPSEGAPGSAHTVVAADPLQWFAYLEGKAHGLRIHPVVQDQPLANDRVTVGLVGGGRRWIIEAVGAGSSSLWDSGWNVGDRTAADRRIWDVAYVRSAENWTGGGAPMPSLAEATDELEAALVAISAFAARLPDYVDGFRNMFAAGLAALRSTDPVNGAYHRDLAPAGFVDAAALRTIDAVQLAWVFGGMGSWNDGAYGGDDEAEGDAVSDRLFAAMQLACAAVANSTYRPAA